MQRLASESGQGHWPCAAEMAGLGFEVRAVDAVAHQRVADVSKMDPDLVGAPGLELARQQRRDRLAVPALEALLELPMGDRLAAVWRTAILSRACGCRSIGASTVPRWRPGTPHTNAMYPRRISPVRP